MRAQPGTAGACPCGSGQAYARCCGRWHSGEPAPTPQALMRSRYSAYVLGLDDYLRATWHPSTRPAQRPDDGEIARWLGLEVRAAPAPAQGVGPDGRAATVGTVEFVARYRVGGRGHRMHEVSRFVLQDGRWYYLDGEQRA